MDTIEEEIDKIPYIDETDDEVLDSANDNNPRKKKCLENIDKKHKKFQVQDQRQTLRLKKTQKSAVDAQTEQDLLALDSLIKSNKQRDDLQELRQDRTQPINVSDVNVIQHKPLSVRPVYDKMNQEQDNISVTGSGLDGKKNDTAEKDKNSDDNGNADTLDGVKLKLEEDSHDKLQLIDNDWNSGSKTPTRTQNIHDQSDKENIESFSRNPNDNEIILPDHDKNANNTSQNTQHGDMNADFMEMQEPEYDNYNGAKPKLYTKRVNGHDMQLKELKLQNFGYSAETDNLIERERGKGKLNKRKSKAKHDSSEQCLTNSGSDIKIFITNEAGNETEALVSESTTETSMNTLNKHLTLSTVTSPSFETVSPDESSKSSSALNYLRKMSEDNEKKGNSLLKQQELYNQQKAKPFQRFSKVKTGMFEVGIEGDEKRSHIKSIIITPGNRLLMFDRNNRSIKMFDSNFNPLDVLVIGTKYCRLTSISVDAFAASLPEQKKISLYNISNMNKLNTDRSLPLEQEYFGIAHFEGKIYVTQRKRATNLTESDKWEIQMIDLNENEEEAKTIRTFSPGHKDCTLHANDQGLYMTNKIENEVLMLGHDGSFLYRHKVEFSLPIGITSDRFGNIYVCGGSVTSFIEVIKPDLRRYRLIFKKTSSNPVALCFDHDSNVLFVCDQIVGKIVRYQIEHNGTVHGLMSTSKVNSSPE